MGRDARDELRRDLEATVGARRELGPSYDDALVESFVERLDSTIEARVETAVAAHREAEQRDGSSDHHRFVIALVSFGTGIPITAVAGGTADLPGVITAWLGIVGVNVAFALNRRR